MPHSFLSFLIKIWDLDSRLRAAGYVLSAICFSNLFGKQRKEDSNSRWTLSLILHFNLRLRGILHMECNFHCTPYMRIISKDLESTRARAPHSLDASRKVLRKDIKGGVLKKST